MSNRMPASGQSARRHGSPDRRGCLTWISPKPGTDDVELEMLKVPPLKQSDRQTLLISTRELLILQLADRGYTCAQIADLIGSTVPAILDSLAAVAARMGVGTDWGAAIEIARQRDLIT
jgi:hypothetical protein